MSDVPATHHETNAAIGELVVLRGDAAGTRYRLRLPLTLIGTAEECDVRIGDGAETHCAITVTPLGPAIRSWHSDLTRVNGDPTVARLLSNGDEVVVGNWAFGVVWHAEEFVELIAVPSETLSKGSDSAAALAEQLEERQRRLTDLLRELADRREDYRRERSPLAAEREKLRRTQTRVEHLRQAAWADRQKVQAMRARFAARMKAKWATERRAVAAERAELERRRRVFVDEVQRHGEDHAAQSADSETYRRRLDAAWALLTEGQRRHIADCRQFEHTLAARKEDLRREVADVAAREAALDTERRRWEAKVISLRNEVAALESRAAQAHIVVQQLEARRGSIESGEASDKPLASFARWDNVPLDRTVDRGVGELLSELAVRERDLARERTALIAVRAELEQQAADLVDQRAVAAEQVVALATARHSWHADEAQTLADLEAIARDLDRRARALVDRERTVGVAERRVQDQTAVACAERSKLDAWQAALAAHEIAAAAARDRLAIELSARRDQVVRWEAAITALCRKWAAARQRDVVRLREEITQWADDRVRLRVAAAAADEVRQRMLDEIARVAAHTLAVEEQRGGNDADPALSRRYRLLRKKWDAHFTRARAEVDSRRNDLASALAVDDDRYRDLARRTLDLAERAEKIVTREQRAEAELLTRSRELDAREATLAVTTATASRNEQELTVLRSEVERVVAVLANDHRPLAPSPIVALRSNAA